MIQDTATKINVPIAGAIKKSTREIINKINIYNLLIFNNSIAESKIFLINNFSFKLSSSFCAFIDQKLLLFNKLNKKQKYIHIILLIFQLIILTLLPTRELLICLIITQLRYNRQNSNIAPEINAPKYNNLCGQYSIIISKS